MRERRKKLKSKNQLNLPLQETLQFNCFKGIAVEKIEVGQAVTIKNGKVWICAINVNKDLTKHEA